MSESSDSDHVRVVASPGGPVVVAFAGLAGAYGIPEFEFCAALDSLGVGAVLVRDVAQVWYQTGVPGLGADLPSSAAALAVILETLAPSRVVLVGNSAGGFAALRFGVELGPGVVDAVVALSPQTCLRRRWRMRHLDRRWRAEARSTHAVAGPESDELDARRWVVGSLPPTEVHVAAGHRLDSRHAQHLRGIPGVDVVAHDHGGHDLARRLRDQGELGRVLVRALG